MKVGLSILCRSSQDASSVTQTILSISFHQDTSQKHLKMISTLFKNAASYLSTPCLTERDAQVMEVRDPFIRTTYRSEGVRRLLGYPPAAEKQRPAFILSVSDSALPAVDECAYNRQRVGRERLDLRKQSMPYRSSTDMIGCNIALVVHTPMN